MTSHPPAATRTEKLITFAAFTALFFIYVAFPTRNYYYDGIFFARVIENSNRLSSSLIHPNHLIYTVFGYLVYRLSRSLGLVFRAVQVLTVVNSLGSVLSAYVLFKIMKLRFSSYVAWCLTFLFAFSATWWKFSTDADAYIISTLFILLSFYLVLSPKTSHLPLLILTFCLAVLFHQLAVLFYPVIILGLLWNVDVRRIRYALEFALGAFLIVLGAYYLLFYLAAGTTDPRRFVTWISSYSPDASFSFNILSNLGYTLRGHGRLLLGGRVSALKDVMNFWVVAMIIVWAGLIGALLLKVIQSIRARHERSRVPMKERFRLDPVTKLCIVWVVIYEGFLFFWLPQNTFYRLFYLPAIVLLIGWIVSRIGEGESENWYRLAMFVAISAIANFLFSIYPFAHIQKNPPLALALEMNHVWPSGTVVYYASENTDNNLFQYFNPDTNWKLLDTRQLESDLVPMSRNGTSVWLDSSAIDQIASTPGGAEWLARHIGARRELIDRSYRIRFIQIVP
ncbi:MAG TPA: hypothetical protein VIG25_25640 [Pyrinomonadaceae bacterium]